MRIRPGHFVRSMLMCRLFSDPSRVEQIGYFDTDETALVIATTYVTSEPVLVLLEDRLGWVMTTWLTTLPPNSWERRP